MEAKDTVMSPIDISRKVGELVALSPMIGEAGVNIKIAEAQAKISWDARDPEIAEAELRGIQKVVEWLKRYHAEATEAEWQAKLEEWGISPK